MFLYQLNSKNIANQPYSWCYGTNSLSSNFKRDFLRIMIFGTARWITPKIFHQLFWNFQHSLNTSRCTTGTKILQNGSSIFGLWPNLGPEKAQIWPIWFFVHNLPKLSLFHEIFVGVTKHDVFCHYVKFGTIKVNHFWLIYRAVAYPKFGFLPKFMRIINFFQKMFQICFLLFVSFKWPKNQLKICSILENRFFTGLPP